ncbi:inositol phosphate phosphatase SopB [Castellaniella sp.]|uniref:inositol phosphate phosphatase SopB n=1 Tax=Castellaniella sp. TaxID=1955812 RepID=UPI002AFE5754|nr:inositol phosphate phosphatase SopB [Castellaniella sp.]
MVIGLNNFRQVGGGTFEREIRLNQGNDQVRQSGVSRLAARISGFFTTRTPQQRDQIRDDRVQVKQQFLTLLSQTEGRAGAQRALQACGLPRDWATNDRPLTNHQVTRILDKSQELRQNIVRHNEERLTLVLNGLDGPESRDLRAAVCRAVRNDSRFGNTPLSQLDVRALRAQAETNLRDVHQSQCQERFPGLSQLVLQAPQGSPLGQLPLAPATLIGGLRQLPTLGGADPQLVGETLDRIDQTTELLGRQAWNQDSLRGLSTELDQQEIDLLVAGQDLAAHSLECQQELDSLQVQRQALGGDEDLDAQIEDLQQQKDVYDALGKDLDHQVELVRAKSAFVEEMRLTDPLTDRSVKHSNLIWAEAGQSLMDRLDEGIARGEPPLTEAQQGALAHAQLEWTSLCIDRMSDYRVSSQNPDDLQSIPAPNKDNQDTHPIVEGKRNTLAALRSKLEEVGIPKKTLDALFSKESLGRAERQALSGIGTWQPLSRDMVVMRDGVMRTYTSEIESAQFMDRSLGVDLGHGRSGGVSAGVRDNVEHARNLKVSRLRDPDGQVMTTVVGHGVLDMWGVDDPQLRQQSNRQGAKEVLEVALSSNARLRDGLTDPNRPQGAPAPRLVHVSVNLISPDSVREMLPGLKDYKEKTYTFNQFEAFDANSGPGQDLRVFSPQGPDGGQVAQVDVDTITFSFGINGIATGAMQHLMFGAWDNVHEHNTRNMVKLIGDLGDGRFGARGARPGGFVGEAYDRLQGLIDDQNTDPAQRQNAENLMAQLRGQTDLVRSMFTEETFRKGNGDTAKMGREILVLQGLAEQGLDLAGVTDLAGTMSKGCKSDKDRGGVTDVELKAKLILRDLGGEMNPDERLEGDDQGVYYTVSSSSGQLENQRWNTGLSGSKEAGHLKDRLPDPEVRQFLCGLGKFAKA